MYFYLKTLEVAVLLCVYFVKIYSLRFLEFVYFSVWRVVRSFLKNWHHANWIISYMTISLFLLLLRQKLYNFCKIWRHPVVCVLFCFCFLFSWAAWLVESVSRPGMEPGPQQLKAWSPNPLGHQELPWVLFLPLQPSWTVPSLFLHLTARIFPSQPAFGVEPGASKGEDRQAHSEQVERKPHLVQNACPCLHEGQLSGVIWKDLVKRS